MNKTNLCLEIEKIPKFILRDVSTSKQVTLTDQEVPRDWTEAKNWKAVTEETNTTPLTFVTKKYKLIQFKDVFMPIIQNIQELHGRIMYYGGCAVMDVFPVDDKLRIDNHRIGIVAVNSVNKTSSVIVKYGIKINGKVVTMPKKIAGFKRVHSGKVASITQNFLTTVDNIKDIWSTVLTEFIKTKVNESFAETLFNEVDLKNDRLLKKVKKYINEHSDVNLWDMFVYMMEMVEHKNYKSELHKRKNLDLISEKMFKYAIISRIINV